MHDLPLPGNGLPANRERGRARAVAITGLADLEGPAGQGNADPTLRHRRSGHLAALTPGKCPHLPSGQQIARLLFSKGFLQQLVLHAEFGEHLLYAPVLFFNGLRLGDHPLPWSLGPLALPWRDIPHTSPAIYRTTRSLSWFAGKPLPGNGIMPCARHKIGHRHAAFSLTQDREELRLSVSACLHSKSPRSSCRENSTYADPYFQRGITKVVPIAPSTHYACLAVRADPSNASASQQRDAVLRPKIQKVWDDN